MNDDEVRSVLANMKSAVARAEAEAKRARSRVVLVEVDDVKEWIVRVERACAQKPRTWSMVTHPVTAEAERLYLDGRGIHCGDMLRMMRDDGSSEFVRYETTHRQATTIEPGGKPGAWERVHYVVTSKGDVDIFAGDDVLFSWPTFDEMRNR